MLRYVNCVVFLGALILGGAAVAGQPSNALRTGQDPEAGYDPAWILLAGDPAPGSRDRTDEPLPGELLLPEGSERKSDEKKQCMTVCALWGEECMLVNKGAGGLERKCRRTCKRFAEECF